MPSSDVYMACREMRSEFKVSIHRSGECNGGFSKEYERDWLKPYGAWKESRHVEQWFIKRPVQAPVEATRVLIPGTELRLLHSAAGDTPPDCWIEMPGESNTVCVEIVLAPERVDFGKEAHPPNIITTWPLNNGDTVWIASKVCQTPDSIKEAIGEFRKCDGMKLDARNTRDLTREDGRILISGPNEKGFVSFIDAASS